MDVQEATDATDWDAYHEAVQAAVRAAIGRFLNNLSLANDKIYQVEIWTDIRARLTSVNFETLHHAFQSMLGGALPLSDEEVHSFRASCAGVVYNTNCADFRFTQYIMVYHPELMGLAQQDFLDEEISRTVCSRVESELAGALKQRINEGDFHRLPHEPSVWFGAYTIQNGEDTPDYILMDA